MNKISVWLLGIFVFSPFFLQAQNDEIVYIEKDKCMQRYEYITVGQFPHDPFLDFHYKNEDNRFIFRTAKEPVNKVSELDKKPLTCKELLEKTPSLLEDLKRGRTEAFVVHTIAEDQYWIYKVDKAILMKETSNSIQYEDGRNDFKYVYNQAYSASEKNLSLRSKSGASVLPQEQKNKNQCLRQRKFRMFSDHAEDPIQDFIFLEKIGLQAVMIGPAQLVLTKIDDLPTDLHVGKICESQDIASTESTGEKDPTDTDEINSFLKNPPKEKDSVKKNGAISFGMGADRNTKIVLDRPMPDPDEFRSRGGDSGTREEKIYGAGVYRAPDEIKDEELIDGKYHKVKSGDVVVNIAKHYKLTIDELLCLNNKDNDRLDIGDMLLVVGECEVTGNPIRRINELTNTAEIIHTVRDGETLSAIAKKYKARYGTDLNRLYNLNQLKDEKIRYKQELIIAVEEL